MARPDVERNQGCVSQPRSSLKTATLILFVAACVTMLLSAATILPAGSLLSPALFAAAMMVALLRVVGGREPRL